MIAVTRRTWVTYAALVGILVLMKIVFTFIPTTFPGADQATAFSWPVILAVSAAGAIGVLLTPYARFPQPWEPSVSNTQRFAIPTLDGIVYGVITVLRDLAKPEDVHLAFPLSIPFYTFGATFLEIMLRVFGLTVLTALLWKVVLRSRAYEPAFWTANVVTSLYEPWPFIAQEISAATTVAVPGILVDWAFQPLFLANLLTGYIYRRSGMLSAVTLRLAFYAVWHVAYGGFRA